MAIKHKFPRGYPSNEIHNESMFFLHENLLHEVVFPILIEILLFAYINPYNNTLYKLKYNIKASI